MSESQTQAQAPRCFGKSRGRCAVCHRATRADELLWFLFCPRCYAIILSEIRSSTTGSGKPGGGGGSKCFSLLAKGAKWKTVEDYRTTVPLRVATWNDEADIFGEEEDGTIPEFTGDLDEINTAQFGPYPDPNVIAVTVVWGVFIGPPSGRRLVEWDMLMNNKDFEWGDASTKKNKGKMDIENIAAHELGHAAGLGHPPDECTEETMYAFASAGETKKRSLEDGDRAGILELY